MRADPGTPARGTSGLAALRLAIAISRDSTLGFSRDDAAYRSIARHRVAAGARTAKRTNAPRQPGAPAIESTTAPPRIPLPTSPPDPSVEPAVDPTGGLYTPPDSDQASILALVTAAQAGDGEAFGQLYDAYVDVVHRYIAYRVGSHSLAEDLTSETFLRALRRISTYSWQGKDFGAWLVTIARNLIADHFKSSRYKLELPTSDLVAAGAERAAAGPEDQVLTDITNAALLDAVKQLGSEQQECIVLRFLQGMSVAETAVILGKKEDAVKALQYRAVKTLGRLLPKELAA